MSAWIAAHRKAIVAAIGAAVTCAAGIWGTDNKWVALAILAATVLGVHGIPNSTGQPRQDRPAPDPPAPGPHRPSAPVSSP